MADLDRKDEAVVVAREAISLYRRLARDRPEVIDDKCAGCLNNLSVILSNSDHKAEALEIVEEVVKIHRQLVAGCPEAFLPDLASSLNNLAVFLSEMGREGEALVIMQESVTIRRPLATARPAISELSQDLARSLMFISRHLSKSGHYAEDLEAIEEAITIWRELPVHLRPSFNKELIVSLVLLDECLHNLGRKEESIAIKLEMMILHHDLESSKDAPPVVQNAEQIDSEVSHNVITLAELLQKLQNIFEKGGLDTTTEQIRQIRQVAEKTGDLHTAADLHQVIQKYVNILRQMGFMDVSAVWPRSTTTGQIVSLRKRSRKPEAITSFIARPIRAISLTVQLAQDLERSKGTCHNDFALKLTKRSAQLFDSGQLQDAVEAVEKAIIINRCLAADNHVAFGPDLASSLNIRFNCLFALGRQQEALDAIKEVVDIQRRLAADRPDIFAPMLEASLHVLAHCLRHLGLDEDAVLLMKEI